MNVDWHPCVSSQGSNEIWRPLADRLELIDGIWQAGAVSQVSYPEDGNELCLGIEESSYWFAHRNRCIVEITRLFPPSGTMYDVGGGNGFVATALQQSGIDVVLVEPGLGVFNALRRGIRKVIRAALEDAGFHSESVSAIGAFDVLEHVADDQRFLAEVHRIIKRGGRFYCTVPAVQALWSHEDILAGHFRRYNVGAIASLLRKTGFILEFATYLFAWLVLPVFLFRTIPFCLRLRSPMKTKDVTTWRRQHCLPRALEPVVRRFQDWELSQLRLARRIGIGTSLLCVARKEL